MLELVSGPDHWSKEEKDIDYCLVGDLLDTLVAADGQCPDRNKRKSHPWPFTGISSHDFGDQQHLTEIWHVLYEADVFLSSVAAMAEQARDRPKAAVEERGGILLCGSTWKATLGTSL
jgi:hypothetical protein